MIVRQPETPVERPGFPWLPSGEYSEIEVFRDRRGLGDFVQILSACERLQASTKTPVKLFGPAGLIPIGEHSPVEVLEAPKINRRRGVFERLPGKKARVYLDYPCPSEGNEIPGNRIDRLTLFHRALGVESCNPSLTITEKEQDWAANWCDQVTGSQNPIVMVYRSAEKWKDFHDPNRLFSLLKKIGPAVCLENQAEVWSTPNTAGMTLRENVALLNQARIVVTPDTGWLHVAGHLKRPIFGLFGAQDPMYRQAIYRVPGGYHQGVCPHKKLPCWYSVCRGKTDIQPCMQTDPAIIAEMVAKTLDRIESTWYFFHIPKTGGVTMQQTLLNFPNVIYPAENPHRFDPQLWGGNQVFTFIRHPVSRAVSAFLWIKHMEGEHAWFNFIRAVDPNKFFEDETVLRQIAEKANDSMLFSQINKLRTVTPHTRRITIFRTEDGLTAGLDRLKLSAPLTAERHNVCREGKFELTAAAKEVIERVYADDLKLWHECEKSTKLPSWI